MLVSFVKINSLQRLNFRWDREYSFSINTPLFPGTAVMIFTLLTRKKSNKHSTAMPVFLEKLHEITYFYSNCKASVFFPVFFA